MLKSGIAKLLLFIIIIYTISCIIYARVIPTGDQPHYLIITQTIIKYHSLNVLLDYNNQDYKSFYPTIIDHHVITNIKGDTLSTHGIGGPVIWLIPFILFNKFGAMLAMSIVAILIVYNIYLFLIENGISKYYSLLTTLIISISSPIYLYSHLLFIETFGALAGIYGIRKCLSNTTLTKKELITLGFVLSNTIWFHIRFIEISIPLIFLILFKLYKNSKFKNLNQYIYFILPILLSFGLFEFYTYFIWGTWNPTFYVRQEPNNFLPGTFSFVYGFIGILFDKNAGLLTNFPIYLLFLVGFILTIKNKLYKINITIIIISIIYLFTISRYKFWSGGWSPPARYIFAIIPMFTYYIAYTIQKLDSKLMRIILIILTSIGLLYNFFTLFMWPFSFESGVGYYMMKLINNTWSIPTKIVLYILTICIIIFTIFILKINKSRNYIND